MRWPWQRVPERERQRIIHKADSASNSMSESVIDIELLMRRIERLYEIESAEGDEDEPR